MPIVPEDDDAMDADADDEDDEYIPDAGVEVGTSSQVCGNGRQAGVPRGRGVVGAGQVVGAGPGEGAGQVVGAGPGEGAGRKLGFLSKGGTRPGRAMGTLTLEMTFQHLRQPAHPKYTLISPHVDVPRPLLVSFFIFFLV